MFSGLGLPVRRGCWEHGPLVQASQSAQDKIIIRVHTNTKYMTTGHHLHWYSTACTVTLGWGGRSGEVVYTKLWTPQNFCGMNLIGWLLHNYIIVPQTHLCICSILEWQRDWDRDRSTFRQAWIPRSVFGNKQSFRISHLSWGGHRHNWLVLLSNLGTQNFMLTLTS